MSVVLVACRFGGEQMEQTDQALKTVIMVGRTEVGKTTLANTLMYGSPEARKISIHRPHWIDYRHTR